LAASIRKVLPVAFLPVSELTSLAGPGSDRKRHRDTAVGGLIGLVTIIACRAGLLGDNDTVQGVIGMLGLVITCLMIGAIDVHYTRKAIDRGEPPDDLS
jgi:hypothetical protein